MTDIFTERDKSQLQQIYRPQSPYIYCYCLHYLAVLVFQATAVMDMLHSEVHMPLLLSELCARSIIASISIALK
jgi:hypothetical protein